METPVYASQVSGLSDARYFSGMGVRWLGIVAIGDMPGYMGPERFREIAGWVSGIDFVLEVDGASGIPDFPGIAERYGASKFLISPFQVEAAVSAGITFGIRCNTNELKALTDASPEFILTETELSPLDKTGSCPVLISSDHSSGSLDHWLGYSPLHGVWVYGSAEEKPGLKEYPAAGILEWLDERNGV